MSLFSISSHGQSQQHPSSVWIHMKHRKKLRWGSNSRARGNLEREGLCYVLSFEVKRKSLSCVRLFATSWTVQSWNSLGKNTGVGSLSLLQEIFPTPGSNPGLLHSRWILYQLSHKGSPRIQEWVVYPFFRGSSWSRSRTRVSSIAGRFFTNWAIKETSIYP